MEKSSKRSDDDADKHAATDSGDWHEVLEKFGLRELYHEIRAAEKARERKILTVIVLIATLISACIARSCYSSSVATPSDRKNQSVKSSRKN